MFSQIALYYNSMSYSSSPLNSSSSPSSPTTVAFRPHRTSSSLIRCPASTPTFGTSPSRTCPTTRAGSTSGSSPRSTKTTTTICPTTAPTSAEHPGRWSPSRPTWEGTHFWSKEGMLVPGPGSQEEIPGGPIRLILMSGMGPPWVASPRSVKKAKLRLRGRRVI